MIDRETLWCDTSGCLMHADYWCVWGCYDQHVSDAKLCLNCMVLKKSKMAEMGPFATRMHCFCGLWIREFFYSSTTDTRHVIMGEAK